MKALQPGRRESLWGCLTVFWRKPAKPRLALHLDKVSHSLPHLPLSARSLSLFSWKWPGSSGQTDRAQTCFYPVFAVLEVLPGQHWDSMEQRSQPGEEDEDGPALPIGRGRPAPPPSRGGKPRAGVFVTPFTALGWIKEGTKPTLFFCVTWCGALQPVWCSKLLQMFSSPSVTRMVFHLS